MPNNFLDPSFLLGLLVWMVYKFVLIFLYDSIFYAMSVILVPLPPHPSHVACLSCTHESSSAQLSFILQMSLKFISWQYPPVEHHLIYSILLCCDDLSVIQHLPPKVLETGLIRTFENLGDRMPSSMSLVGLWQFP